MSGIILPSPSFSYLSGNIGSSVGTTANTLMKVMDTASLAVGTWLINFSILIGGSAGYVTVGASVAADTATATITGQPGAGCEINAGDSSQLSISCVAVVTVAGTLQLEIQSTAIINIYATDQTTFNNSTGYTALKIA